MKKLFLLIIASWATSCLPAPDTESSSAQAQTKKTFSLQNFNEITRENQLNKSFNGGIGSVIAGLTVPLCCGALPFLSITTPIYFAVGFATIATCSFVQEWASEEDDKNKTTGKERAFEHVKGMGSVVAAIFLFRRGAQMVTANRKKSDDKKRSDAKNLGELIEI